MDFLPEPIPAALWVDDRSDHLREHDNDVVQFRRLDIASVHNVCSSNVPPIIHEHC